MAQKMTQLYTTPLFIRGTLIIDQLPRVLALSSLGRAVIYAITHWNVITHPHCVTSRKISIVED